MEILEAEDPTHCSSEVHRSLEAHPETLSAAPQVLNPKTTIARLVGTLK